MLSIGLVGLPNAGKSTLFNLLSGLSVPAENFPFCTIEPNAGIVEVPDPRVHELAKISNAQKEIYAAIEFKDIAGLVKNASGGAGLGNQFLSHIRECDLILMVVRAFENDNIIHVENRVNPMEDEEILMLELILSDEQLLEKLIPRMEKDLKSNKDKFLGQKIEIVEKILTKLTDLKPASDFVLENNLDKEIYTWRKGLNLLTDKPVLKLANINQDGQNIAYPADFNLDILLESGVTELSPNERFELGLDSETGLDKLIRACYDKLGLATYLTCGEKESRAWTFEKGLTAPQCAGKIHSDFEKTFIKSDTVSYNDFVTLGGWKGAFEKGKVRSEGKDYIMQDGDVVEFKLNK